jgi:hypothetical protein
MPMTGHPGPAALHPPTVLPPLIVTAPAAVVNALPFREAPTPSVMPACATTVPAKVTPLSVAALVTCQKMLHALAPLSRSTFEPTFAVTALPTWKM